MNVVHVADEGPGLPGEIGGAQAVQEVSLDEPVVDVSHASGNIGYWLEVVAALGDFDGAGLTRPLVGVLQQVPVDGAEMNEVELAARRPLLQPVGHKAALNLVQLVSIANIELVSKDGRAGIDVGGATHPAARFRTLAMMSAALSSKFSPSRSNIANMARSSSVRGLPSISWRRTANANRSVASGSGLGTSFCAVIGISLA